jgi:hypothetical protein
LTRNGRGLSLRCPGWWALTASLLGHLAVLAAAWVFAASAPSNTPQSVSVWTVTLVDAPSPLPEPAGEEEQERSAEPPTVFASTVTVAEPVAEETPLPQAVSGGVAADPSSGGQVIGGGGGGPGGRSSATFFQVPVRGQSVVFLLDRSSSMGLSGGLATAKRETAAALQRLPADARFQVIVYNRDPQCLVGPRALLPATPGNVQQALDALDAVGAAGATDHIAAVRWGLQLQPDVLFLVTDADDLTPAQVRSLTDLNGGRTVIHTLAWGPAAADALRLLAEHNGGTHRGLSLEP